MASNPANELASILQSASLNRAPSPTHDLNPSTTASLKTPVTISSSSAPATTTTSDKIPLSILHPAPRHTTLPPLPDLRFEQSYLARIRDASPARTAWLTLLDHVLMPLAQGLVWNLLLAGWRVWNSGAKFAGQGVGAKVRRWWWRTNNWTLPREAYGRGRGMKGLVGGKDVAEEMGEFYEMKFGTAGGD